MLLINVFSSEIASFNWRLLFDNPGKVGRTKNQLSVCMLQPGAKKDLITFADQLKLGLWYYDPIIAAVAFGGRWRNLPRAR